MKAHIDHYKRMERATPPEFAAMVQGASVQTIREIAEDGFLWHLVHFRDRAEEVLGRNQDLSSFARARLLMTRGVQVTEHGPSFDARSLVAADNCFADSIRKKEKVGPALHNRGNVALQLSRDVYSAERFCQAAVESGYKEANVTLAAIQPNLGKGVEVQEALYRQAFPTEDPAVHNSFGSFLYDQARYSEARPYFAGAVEYGMPAAYFKLAQTDHVLGNTRDSVSNMVRAALYRVPHAFFVLKQMGYDETQIMRAIETARRQEDAIPV